MGRQFVEGLTPIYDTFYEVGTVPDLLCKTPKSSDKNIFCNADPASGGSFDWTKGVAGIKWSSALELRDQGFYGFLLPADQIIESGIETLEGLRGMLDHLSGQLEK